MNGHAHAIVLKVGSSDSQLEVLVNGQWVPSTNLKLHKKKLVKSPRGLILCYGYSCGDKHSVCYSCGDKHSV